MCQFIYLRIRDAFLDLWDYLLVFFKEYKMPNTADSMDRTQINLYHIREYRQWCKSAKYTDIGIDRTLQGVLLLSKLLYNAYNERRVVILIDAFDALLTQALEKFPTKQVNGIRRYLKQFMCNTTNGDINYIIQAILVTGVFFANDVGLSDDVKIAPCRFLDDGEDRYYCFDRNTIVPFYGLNEADLKKFFKKLQGLKNLDDNWIETKKVEVNKMFGYLTNNRRMPIYPLFHVISYLIHKAEEKEKVVVVEEEQEVVMMKKSSFSVIPSILQAFPEAPQNPDIAIVLLGLMGGEDVVINYCCTIIPIDYLIKLRETPKEDYNNIYLRLLIETGFLSQPKADPSRGRMLRIRFSNDMMRKTFFDVLYEYKIQVGDFPLDKQYVCAFCFRELVDYVLSGCEKETVWKYRLVSLNKSLTDYFKGINYYQKFMYNERKLHALISNVFQICMKDGFTYHTPRRSMKDQDDNQGYIDIWLVDEKSEIAVITELRCGLNESLEKYTSVYGLNEAIGSEHRERKVNYRDKWFDEREGVFKKLIFLSITIDRLFQSSISVTFSRKPPNNLKEPYYCVSALEKQYENNPKYNKFEFLHPESK